MRRLFLFIISTLLSTSYSYGGYITQQLLDKMAASAPNELIPIIIMMNEQSDIYL